GHRTHRPHRTRPRPTGGTRSTTPATPNAPTRPTDPDGRRAPAPKARPAVVATTPNLSYTCNKDIESHRHNVDTKRRVARVHCRTTAIGYRVETARRSGWCRTWSTWRSC